MKKRYYYPYNRRVHPKVELRAEHYFALLIGGQEPDRARACWRRGVKFYKSPLTALYFRIRYKNDLPF